MGQPTRNWIKNNNHKNHNINKIQNSSNYLVDVVRRARPTKCKDVENHLILPKDWNNTTVT